MNTLCIVALVVFGMICVLIVYCACVIAGLVDDQMGHG